MEFNKQSLPCGSFKILNLSCVECQLRTQIKLLLFRKQCVVYFKGFEILYLTIWTENLIGVHYEKVFAILDFEKRKDKYRKN